MPVTMRAGFWSSRAAARRCWSRRLGLCETQVATRRLTRRSGAGRRPSGSVAACEPAGDRNEPTDWDKCRQVYLRSPPLFPSATQRWGGGAGGRRRSEQHRCAHARPGPASTPPAQGRGVRRGSSPYPEAPPSRPSRRGTAGGGGGGARRGWRATWG